MPSLLLESITSTLLQSLETACTSALFSTSTSAPVRHTKSSFALLPLFEDQLSWYYGHLPAFDAENTDISAGRKFVGGVFGPATYGGQSATEEAAEGEGPQAEGTTDHGRRERARQLIEQGMLIEGRN